MLGWAESFLILIVAVATLQIIAFFAAMLGYFAIADMSMQIAWILMMVGIVVAGVLALRGRRPRS